MTAPAPLRAGPLIGFLFIHSPMFQDASAHWMRARGEHNLMREVPGGAEEEPILYGDKPEKPRRHLVDEPCRAGAELYRRPG